MNDGTNTPGTYLSKPVSAFIRSCPIILAPVRPLRPVFTIIIKTDEPKYSANCKVALLRIQTVVKSE